MGRVKAFFCETTCSPWRQDGQIQRGGRKIRHRDKPATPLATRGGTAGAYGGSACFQTLIEGRRRSSSAGARPAPPAAELPSFPRPCSALPSPHLPPLGHAPPLWGQVSALIQHRQRAVCTFLQSGCRPAATALPLSEPSHVFMAFSFDRPPHGDVSFLRPRQQCFLLTVTSLTLK